MLKGLERTRSQSLKVDRSMGIQKDSRVVVIMIVRSKDSAVTTGNPQVGLNLASQLECVTATGTFAAKGSNQVRIVQTLKLELPVAP
jgi:hypothetical protein